jgi:RNA polymerase sigma factor FliA
MTPTELVGMSAPVVLSCRPEADAQQLSRNELVMAHLPIVTSTAQRLLMKLPPSVEADDIYSVGIVGLIDAADRFDASRTIKFRTYAEARIKGSMLDYLRSLSWAPRRLYSRARELKRVRAAFEAAAGCSATVSELAEAMGITVEQYHALVSEISLIELQNSDELCGDDGDGHSGSPLADQASDPLVEIERKEMMEIIRQAIEELPDRQKTLLELYYEKELTLKEIGAALNITESRASQLHAKALTVMRREIGKLMNSRPLPQQM